MTDRNVFTTTSMNKKVTLCGVPKDHGTDTSRQKEQPLPDMNYVVEPNPGAGMVYPKLHQPKHSQRILRAWTSVEGEKIKFSQMSRLLYALCDILLICMTPTLFFKLCWTSVKGQKSNVFHYCPGMSNCPTSSSSRWASSSWLILLTRRLRPKTNMFWTKSANTHSLSKKEMNGFSRGLKRHFLMTLHNPDESWKASGI